MLVLIVLLAAVGAWWHWGSREQSYDGLRLSQWLMDERLKPALVEQAVRSMGTNALPALIQMAQKRNPPITRALLALNGYMPKKWELRIRRASDYHEAAERGFEILGPVALPALPALLSIADEPDNDEAGTYAQWSWTLLEDYDRQKMERLEQQSRPKNTDTLRPQ